MLTVDADRNLLFGVLALQADLIDAQQFVEACSAWASRKATPLADLLVRRGWLDEEGKEAVEVLVRGKLKKHAGDVHASLAAVADDRVRDALSGLDVPEVRDTLDRLPPRPEGHVLLSTIGYTPESRERYTLTRLHAKGGIGQVWLARDPGLGRDVALKELRPERAGHPTAWARFVEEARITGQLEHPNIVPVHELFEPPGGRQPFYTMRFVRGRTLSEAIRDYHARRREGRAGPLDRMTLLNAFVGVCNAVAYAHSRGVIHRDLKPQNVVLGDYGEVILLDWGLAKVVGHAEEVGAPTVVPGDTPDRSETMPGQALGTPAYMAPEQAAGQLDRIDRHSDVYGLGAILYEVLAGEPPFSGSDTAEVLRKVVQEEPPRPRSACPDAPPALEAVCLTALAKRPEDRYGSAAELADEVRHFLADEPVAAYREPLSKRLGRWGRRHKPVVAGAAALLATAMVALSVGAVLINRERARAEESFRQARAAVDDYFTTVSQSKLLDVPGLQPLRKELLESARKYYQSFLRQRGSDLSVRAETAATHWRLGFLLREIGPQDDARAAYEWAVADYRDLVRAHPGVTKYQTDLAICYNDLANLERASGRTDEALRLHREALALRERVARAHPKGARYQNELAKSYANIGNLLLATGKPAEALRAQERARELNEGGLGARGDDLALDSDLGRPFDPAAMIRRDLISNDQNIGWMLATTGKLAEALSALQRARDLGEALVADRPTVPDCRSALAAVHHDLGYRLAQAGRPAEALDAYRRAVATCEALTSENPSVVGYRDQLATSYASLANLLYEMGRAEEALRNQEKVRDIYEKLAAENPDIVRYRAELARSANNIGYLLTEAVRPAEALRSLEQGRSIREALATAHPDDVEFRAGLARSYYYIGRVPPGPGSRDEALRALRRAEAIYAGLPDLGPEDRFNLACIAALRVTLAGLGKDRLTDEEEAARRRDADSAMDALRRAVAHGYKNLNSLKKEKDLDALRPREDFRDLLRQLAEGQAVAGR